MKTTPPIAEEEIFQTAIALPPPERVAYLDAACGEDLALRVRLERLLGSHDQSGFMQPPAESLSPSPEVEAELARLKPEEGGEMIGPYKLREQIGEGGFGTVWVADQESPVRRRVALKIIKLGMDTKEVIARFEQERQALAMMDHPNIAKILDAGVTQFGRPFFVMELVRGVKITEYCDEKQLSTPERIELFITVCQAIQHAHQKGIIHRDLKPSNILVTINDGKTVPKVIDFGVAKATQGRLTDLTVYTQFQQMIGTPLYMSPEQADMTSLDVDTRSDIYALGVLLYELLTGRTPIDQDTFARVGMDELRRLIREVDPPRPSMRVRTLDGAEKTTAAKRRSTEPAKLFGALRGDLDWIVMKCIEKDRARRYDTANGLALDLKRHLQNEVITARPPTASYLLGKLIRRNKLAFAAGTAIAVSLVIGIGMSTWQYFEKSRAFERVVESEGEQKRLRKAAEGAEQTSKEQRDLAQTRLVDSLIGEAQSIRLAHQVGYRRQVNDRIRQALEVPSARQHLEALRAEAAQCLGDPLGMDPLDLSALPKTFECAALDTTGSMIAMGTANDGVVLQETAKEAKPVSIPTDGVVASLAFSLNGRSLFGIVQPRAPMPSIPRLVTWKRAPDDSWPQIASREMPGASSLFESRQGTVAAASVEGNIVLTGLETDQTVARIPLETQYEWPPVIGISPDLHLVAIRAGAPQFSSSNEVAIWDLQTGSRRTLLSPGLGPVISVSFGADGRYIACTCDAGVQVFDTGRFESVATFHGYFGAFHPADRGASLGGDGGILALPFLQEGRMRMIKVASGAELACLSTENPHDARFSMDGSTLVALGAAAPRLLRITSGPEKLSLGGHIGGVACVEFSPDGSLVASTGKDRKIKYWDAHTGKLLATSADLPDAGQTIGFSPDGKLLASGNWGNNKVQIWSTESHQLLLTFGESDPNRIWSCVFSPDGRYFVAAGGGVRAWELIPKTCSTPDFHLIFSERDPFGRNAVFDPSSRAIYCEGVVKLENRERLGIFRRSLEKDAEWELLMERTFIPVQGLALAPRSGELVVQTLEGRGLSFFNRQTQQTTRNITTLRPGETASSPVYNFQFSPDGTKVAVTDHSRRGVTVFDAVSGQSLYVLPEEFGAVWWLTWDTTGRRLAIGRADGDIAIWDLEKVGQALKELGVDAVQAPPSADAKEK